MVLMPMMLEKHDLVHVSPGLSLALGGLPPLLRNWRRVSAVAEHSVMGSVPNILIMTIMMKRIRMSSAFITCEEIATEIERPETISTNG